MFPSFIFFHNADYPHLHSFPTRRSSDLGRRVRRCHRRHRRVQLLRLADADGGVQDLQRQDRKSTRLNSSHVEISYAVFCLKKKKKSPKITNFRFPPRRGNQTTTETLPSS